ncbi:MAG: aldehyde dehydrogenase family protein [Deltaproteobacteria bacterium]|nr:MAG: aldehyde dehydrogenase family protein [Deltaproteobacteria bacterium]
MSAPSESEVQELARTIAAAGAAEPARVFHLSWWSESMLDWALAHPRFKTQLFRFVDVFPACRDDGDVMLHLEDYFATIDVPPALGVGLGVAAHLPFGAQVTAAAARRNIRRMARQLIAGATPAEAMPRLARLWRKGEGSSVDVLGERTITGREADAYATRVAALLDTFAKTARRWPANPRLEQDPWGTVPRVNVSVKPTALSPLFAPLTAAAGLADVRDRLHPLLERARRAGATVHLDMEQDEAKDLTLELLRSLGDECRAGPQLGCVVQAYRRDAFDDLHALVAWSAATLRLPLHVRLVKGAYWDVETVTARAEGWPVPVFEHKAETDLNYERCARYLVAHAGAVRPAFGSHNVRSLAYAIAAARAHGLPDAAIELQLLYGMAEPVHAALARLGFRVRVYAPVGALVPGMAYLVRRLLENTSNESFIRHRFAEGATLDALIAPPDAHAAADDDREGRDAAPIATGSALVDAAAEPPRFRNEPHAELRRPAARASLAAAVAAAPATFGFDAPVVIDGRAVQTTATIRSVDPGAYATLVCTSGRAGVGDVEHALTTACTAAASWAAVPWSERAAVLIRAAAILRARRAELAALEVFEAGKPEPEADADVCEAIDFCEYYAREAFRLGRGAGVLSTPGETNAYRYQPRGVGVVIAPWNFPLAIPTGMVTAALVTGNCVVFKPAEQTPGIGYRLVEVLHAAGVPPGALAFLPGIGEEIGPALVDHPDVAFVAFTGSKSVGLSIVERGAAHHAGQGQVKRVVAEMGGKNAIVVDSDADLDQAVPAIVASAFAYAGQKCSAASRVIVLAPVLDALLERLVGATALLPLGHPRALDTVIGPLIDEDAWRRVRGYRDVARVEGDVVYTRDDVPDGGWYVGPTIVVVDGPRCRVATEEIFGPVLTIMPAADFEHALALANDTEYALTAGVFSRSPTRIRRAAETLRAGNIYVNRTITGARVGRQPFGGYGLSGVGTKTGGPDYLLQFVDPRVVTENTIRQGFAPREG